ncbi:microfibril-associated glycoprotein 4-like isoform X3 [Sander lucioperca]|uniref:microfibril-associated glycoprotein 4-like isoform X3 n=1 Tax=Sander lucioperca TaxID=283035 RepID=UPI00125E88B2|nr:microfibril-associated glycoprotein 4-like isoform X3 [Sander lucioperca]
MIHLIYIQLIRDPDGLTSGFLKPHSSRTLTMKLVSVVILLLAPMLTSCYPPDLPKDCSDIHNNPNTRKSGVYTIYPISSTSPVQVYCDMDSEGGGWTVFQTRMDGTVNFYRGWDHYKTGFGNPAGEYWLGLENIYQLTLNRPSELLVQMENFGGNKAFALYTSFFIDAECNGYRLNVSGFINGGAGDALTYHNGQKFTTIDKDQDSSPYWNCAIQSLGAFWYNYCYNTNPNGLYRWEANSPIYNSVMNWQTWYGYNNLLKFISMSIRSV